MTTWSSLFNHRHLLSRVYYFTPGVQTITAPPKSAYICASAVGAGGWDNGVGGPSHGGTSGGAPGYGAAFAKVKAACAPGAAFSLQVGDIAHSQGAGTSAGDSTLTTSPGGVVLLNAARGSDTAAGNASNCVGDVKRTGGAPSGSDTTAVGGMSAGDDADTFPLGFGGRGSSQFLGAARGGGGTNRMLTYIASPGGVVYALFLTTSPGDGLVCVEFFDQNPNIAWPGY